MGVQHWEWEEGIAWNSDEGEARGGGFESEHESEEEEGESEHESKHGMGHAAAAMVARTQKPLDYLQ